MSSMAAIDVTNRSNSANVEHQAFIEPQVLEKTAQRSGLRSRNTRVTHSLWRARGNKLWQNNKD
jgi:hypothetical protein